MSKPPGPPSSGPEDIDGEVRQAFLAHAKVVLRSAVRAAAGDYAAAEDATQQAFIKAVDIWPGFREWQLGKQRAWLCTTARCRLIDSWRAYSREIPAEALPVEQTSRSAEDIALSALAWDRFWEVVNTMPPRAARVAYLRWHEEWTMDEIAKHLGINRATAIRDLNSVLKAARGQAEDEIGFRADDDQKEG